MMLYGKVWCGVIRNQLLNGTGVIEYQFECKGREVYALCYANQQYLRHDYE